MDEFNGYSLRCHSCSADLYESTKIEHVQTEAQIHKEKNPTHDGQIERIIRTVVGKF